MRCLLSALLLPTLLQLPLALAQENEGEKLFRAMEKKITAAKVIQIVAEMDDQGEAAKFKASLILTKGNKARVRVRGDVKGQKMSTEMTSDGSKMKVLMMPGGREEEQSAKKLHGLFSTMVSRVGLIGGLRIVRVATGGKDRKDPDLEKLFRLSSFKLGGADSVRGHNAKVLTYTVHIGGNDADAARVTLWVDAKTLLPLKRAIVPQTSAMRITEYYDEFKLDAEVDAKTFEFPK